MTRVVAHCLRVARSCKHLLLGHLTMTLYLILGARLLGWINDSATSNTLSLLLLKEFLTAYPVRRIEILRLLDRCSIYVGRTRLVWISIVDGVLLYSLLIVCRLLANLCQKFGGLCRSVGV